MPELPDVTVYVEALRRRIDGRVLRAVRVAGPSLVRTWEPPLAAAHGRRIRGIERLGKRIVIGLDADPPETDELFLVLHLMVAGRLRWRAPATRIPGRIGLAAFDFDDGTLILSEASAKKRASLYLVRERAALADHDPGGIEVLEAGPEEFAARLRAENHTLKRALTSPRLLSGIGNAYSDEILWHARLSPLAWTSRLTDEQMARLHASTVEVLREWTDRLRDQVGEGFPEKVTAFREGMAVHGRFGEPCPRCGSPVQRILYADRETNYCAPCQTGGQVYADRVLSRLLKGDWPRSIEEWEAIRSQ